MTVFIVLVVLLFVFLSIAPVLVVKVDHDALAIWPE
jgi:hypothetical protein